MLESEALAALAQLRLEEEAARASHSPPRRRRLILTALGGLVLAVVASALALLFREAPRAKVQQAVPPAPAGPGSFPSNSAGKKLRCVGIRNLAAVKDARIGLITIAEDDRKQEIPLTPTMLQAGKLVFWSHGQDGASDP